MQENKDITFIRTEWTSDFYPEIITHQLPTFKRMDHSDHTNAKSGDIEAAFRLAKDMILKLSIDKLIEITKNKGDIILAPVSAIEKQGVNFIPDAMAEVISFETGFTISYNIKQVNSPQRTNRGASYRMVNQPIFDGNVVKGKNYIIIDDHATLGATLANLKGFIEFNGGIVLAATTLSASVKILAPDGKSFAKIKSACGHDFSEQYVNDFIKKETEHEIHYKKLTRGEMGYIAQRITDARKLSKITKR